MNQKGQGSGVFQLLISAVVAMAILGVLLSILGVINIQGSQDAANTARNTLKEAWNNQENSKTSPKIQFKKTDIITGRGAAGPDLGLDYKDVCVGIADDLDADGIFAVSGSVVTYTGTNARDVKIGAVCTTGDQLEGFVTSTLSTIWEVSTISCENNDILAATNRVGCVVVVINP